MENNINERELLGQHDAKVTIPLTTYLALNIYAEVLAVKNNLINGLLYFIEVSMVEGHTVAKEKLEGRYKLTVGRNIQGVLEVQPLKK